MSTPAGTGAPVNIQLTKEVSVHAAVMASAGSPGGSSVHNSQAWQVITDEAINHPSAWAHFLPLPGRHSPVPFSLISSLSPVHM